MELEKLLRGVEEDRRAGQWSSKSKSQIERMLGGMHIQEYFIHKADSTVNCASSL